MFFNQLLITHIWIIKPIWNELWIYIFFHLEHSLIIIKIKVNLFHIQRHYIIIVILVSIITILIHVIILILTIIYSN
jgi:hypothetical protein